MEKHWKTLEQKEIIRKQGNEKNIKEQSKLTFIGFHKRYKNLDCHTFKQNEVLMFKPICLEVAVLELSKLLMYET